MFCKSCGKQLPDNATVCPNCGAPVTVAAPMGGAAPMSGTPAWTTGAPVSGAQTWGATPQKPVQHVSGAWYLVPFLFGILGGIIAWAVNRDKDPGRARNLLIFGVLWTVVPILIGVAVFILAAPPPTTPHYP